MGRRSASDVMVSRYGTLIFVSFIACSLASFCEQGKTYHHADLQRCVNCSTCKEGEVVIRPCEIHRDTHCGVLELKDILNFITPNPAVSQNPHRHHKHKNHRHRNHEDQQIVWKYPDDAKRDEDAGSGSADGASDEKAAPAVSSTEAPFSSAETLVWDWQAIALSTAVFTCILFFLVITLYSLHQAKQWRRLKENFEADVEELSASLMAAAAAQAKNDDVEKGGGVDCRPAKTGNVPDGNYLNRCVYLEQLLNVRKNGGKDPDSGEGGGGGNVYIAPKLSPIP